MPENVMLHVGCATTVKHYSDKKSMTIKYRNLLMKKNILKLPLYIINIKRTKI